MLIGFEIEKLNKYPTQTKPVIRVITNTPIKGFNQKTCFFNINNTHTFLLIGSCHFILYNDKRSKCVTLNVTFVIY